MTERDTGSSAPLETFDDPALKAALKRSLGGEQCSQALRERCCCLCSGSSNWRFAAWGIVAGLAAAAVVVLTVAVPMFRPASAARLAVDTRQPAPTMGPVSPVPPGSPVSPGSPSAPAALWADLVDTHERCVHSADHHRLDKGAATDAAIADAMRTRLSHAVLVARPTDPRWVFRGAAICRAGDTPCGHLVFSRGDQAISVFSLPSSAAPQLQGQPVQHILSNGHPIVAFVKDGALFCLVGSGPVGTISTDDLDQMRQRMQNDVTADAPDHSTVLAELLTPVGP
jgi:hypothetical protein